MSEEPYPPITEAVGLFPVAPKQNPPAISKTHLSRCPVCLPALSGKIRSPLPSPTQATDLVQASFGCQAGARARAGRKAGVAIALSLPSQLGTS